MPKNRSPRPLFTAPPTRRSPTKEPVRTFVSSRQDPISMQVLNMRLTESQRADLDILKNATAINVQAHIRRAIIDYVHAQKLEHPEWFNPPPTSPLPPEDSHAET